MGRRSVQALGARRFLSASAGATNQLGVALVVLMTTLVLVIPLQSAASGIPRSPGQVHLILHSPSPQRLYEDRVTHLSGRLTSGEVGKRIVLRVLSEGSWSRIGSTRTTVDGRFELDYRPRDPGVVTIRAKHHGRHGRIRSRKRTLTVLDRRVYLVTRPSYDTFTDVRVTGRVVPPAGHRLIVMQHLVAGHWVSGARGYTDPDGRYAILMRNNHPGPWAVRASWGGSDPAGGTLELSGVHHYQVHAVLHPVVTHVTRKQLGGSYHAGCPVGPAELRNIGMTFKTFGPLVHRGTLVVRDSIVSRSIAVLRLALEHRYPIRRMFTTAHYGGSDIAAMNHDDTSAFNCRHVTGDPTRLSPHSYGIAVDINTVENPYQDVHGHWWPRHFGFRFRNRSVHRPGMLYDGSVVTKAWKSRGFQWGGDWSHPDYQHFDTLGNGPRRQAAKTSGPLTVRALPAPASFGNGWRRYADPGGAEAGWEGNGTFAHARNAGRASRQVFPLGCSTAPTFGPSAAFALQGSYRSSSGALGQAVVLQFSDARRAAAYFATLRRALTDCTAPDGPSGVRVSTEAWSRSRFLGRRVYGNNEAWTERDVRAGARVTVALSAE